MSKSQEPPEFWFNNGLEYEQLAVITEAIQEVYKEGKLVKVLDSAGKPKLRRGQQLYKSIDRATTEERDFWFQENRSNSLPA